MNSAAPPSKASPVNPSINAAHQQVQNSRHHQKNDSGKQEVRERLSKETEQKKRCYENDLADENRSSAVASPLRLA